MSIRIRYEFGSTAHRNEADMLAVIAAEYLSAGGWGLGNSTGEEPSHMEFNDYTLRDLACAFGDLR